MARNHRQTLPTLQQSRRIAGAARELLDVLTQRHPTSTNLTAGSKLFHEFELELLDAQLALAPTRDPGLPAAPTVPEPYPAEIMPTPPNPDDIPL